MDAADAARAYYRAIDDGAYDDLAALLTPDFVHIRPDRTLEGRDGFVRFMREDRPLTDTGHAIDGLYRGADGVAVRGRLVHDGEAVFAFVDVFEADSGRLASLRSYTS